MAMQRLVFAGANGFGALNYWPLLRTLVERHGREVVALDYYPFARSVLARENVEVESLETRMPVARQGAWEEVIDGMAGQVEESAAAGQGQVVGVGHSLGGALLHAVAAKRPELFESIVIIEPPMFRQSLRVVIAALQACRLFSKTPLVRKAHGKRWQFASMQEVSQMVHSSSFFMPWHPDSKQAFMHFALEPAAAKTAAASDASPTAPGTHGELAPPESESPSCVMHLSGAEPARYISTSTSIAVHSCPRTGRVHTSQGPPGSAGTAASRKRPREEGDGDAADAEEDLSCRYSFRPVEEVFFYLNTPTDLFQQTTSVYRPCTLPGYFVHCNKHDFLSPADVASLQKHVFSTLKPVTVRGAHFFPLHEPLATAQLIATLTDAYADISKVLLGVAELLNDPAES